MYLAPFPVFSLCGASVFVILGVTMLVAWARARPSDSPRLQTGVLASAVLALVMVAALTTLDAYRYAEFDRAIHTSTFRYTVELEADGTGISRITLPIPVEGDLLSILTLVPATASAIINWSGPEPSLDVVFSDNATLTASLTQYYARFDANLSYTDDVYRCANRPTCPSELDLGVLSGDVGDVAVRMDVTWTYGCERDSWQLDAVTLPGRHVYTGRWTVMVC